MQKFSLRAILELRKDEGFPVNFNKQKEVKKWLICDNNTRSSTGEYLFDSKQNRNIIYSSHLKNITIRTTISTRSHQLRLLFRLVSSGCNIKLSLASPILLGISENEVKSNLKISLSTMNTVTQQKSDLLFVLEDFKLNGNLIKFIKRIDFSCFRGTAEDREHDICKIKNFFSNFIRKSNKKCVQSVLELMEVKMKDHCNIMSKYTSYCDKLDYSERQKNLSFSDWGEDCECDEC